MDSIPSAFDPVPPNSTAPTCFGWWYPDRLLPVADSESLSEAIRNFRQTHILVQTPEGIALGSEGSCSFVPAQNGQQGLAIRAILPPLQIAALGDLGFCRKHGLRFPYLSGAMANGIGSVEIVEAMARAGMLGFFGAAGLSLQRVEEAIHRLKGSLGELPFGFNLIHSPNEP